MKMFGREMTANELKTFVVSYSDKDEIRMPSAWAIELIGYKEQNAELETLRAENKELISSAVQWSDLSETLRAENALLSERVSELEKKLERQRNAARGYYAEWDKNKTRLEKRIEELNDINESDKFQYQKLCDKLYSMKSELEARKQREKELEENFRLLSIDYFALKAEREAVHVTVRCEKCK